VLKLSALILSTVILLQSITFSTSAIVEIANFVEHYNLHKQTQHDSFVEFISKHYGDMKNQHNKDQSSKHHNHQRLPFNNSNATHLFVGVIDINFDYELVVDRSLDYLTNFRYTDGVSTYNPLDLIQPPRIA